MLGTNRGLRVGIEFRRHEIHCVALKTSGAKAIVFAAKTFTFDWIDPNRVIPELKQFVQKNHLRRASAVLGVLSERVLVRYLHVPALPEKALRQYIGAEIGTSIHLPFENPVFDVAIVEKLRESDSESKETAISLVVAPRETIDKMVAVTLGAELKPVVIEISPLALYRMTAKKKVEGLEVLLQRCTGELTISVFFNGNLYLLRSVDLMDHAESELKSPDALCNEITYEVQRVVNFFNFNLTSTEQTLQNFYIQSNLQALDEVCHLVEVQLGIRPQVIFPPVSDKSTVEWDANYYSAIGLGLRGFGKS